MTIKTSQKQGLKRKNINFKPFQATQSPAHSLPLRPPTGIFARKSSPLLNLGAENR